MGRRSGPKRGSMQFYPRTKTKRIYPTVSSFIESEKPKLMAFPAYKAGMTHIVATENYDKATAFGQQVAIPVTILETPEVLVFGLRLYEKTPYGMKAITEVLAEKLPKELGRKFNLPKEYKGQDKLAEAEKLIEKTAEIRAIVATQPTKIDLKKTPEVLEITIGGKDIKSQWDYAKTVLGKEIKSTDVLSEGAWIDVTGVTRGFGTQGPVKIFGIKIQVRKAQGHRRRPGAIGAWHPNRVLYTVPMQGQYGFFKRTEYNKRILKIGVDGKEVTPKGGFVNYGNVSSYLMVKGSVPGIRKRLLVVREALRHNKNETMPTITHISTATQQ